MLLMVLLRVLLVPSRQSSWMTVMQQQTLHVPLQLYLLRCQHNHRVRQQGWEVKAQRQQLCRKGWQHREQAARTPQHL